MSKKVEKYLDEAITNIRNDREITRELLNDAINWLSKDEARHREVGMVMSKYVETLQRSNEQLVKLVGMMSKQDGSGNLTSKDMSEIYDMISKEDEEPKDGKG